jgi:hypothetical protein
MVAAYCLLSSVRLRNNHIPTGTFCDRPNFLTMAMRNAIVTLCGLGTLNFPLPGAFSSHHFWLSPPRRTA